MKLATMIDLIGGAILPLIGAYLMYLGLSGQINFGADPVLQARTYWLYFLISYILFCSMNLFIWINLKDRIIAFLVPALIGAFILLYNIAWGALGGTLIPQEDYVILLLNLVPLACIALLLLTTSSGDAFIRAFAAGVYLMALMIIVFMIV